jgi:Icc-related predicted phosphoesterase
VTQCIFVSDLHGHLEKYRTLFRLIADELPRAVFVGGDFLPSGRHAGGHPPPDFVHGFLMSELVRLRQHLTTAYPSIFLIMGNDDERTKEAAVLELQDQGLIDYIHGRQVAFGAFLIYGYAYVPPTPFLLKDWERYDVSRYVDPGDVSPEEGVCSTPIDEYERKYATIKDDLALLVGDAPLDRAVFLFHAPPYGTHLDRCALDGVKIDGVQLDLHVGSIAIRDFIESRQPLLTLHGHIHESPRLTGAWRDQIGRTHLLSAAHDGAELALVQFDLEDVAQATRRLIPLKA